MNLSGRSPRDTSPSPRRLRWPIHHQLLLPMVSVVLLADLLATAITAYWLVVRVRAEQAESQRRVAKTVAEATFPLTERVLSQLSGLSGAEFVLISPEGRLEASTLRLERPWLRSLAEAAKSRPLDGHTRRPSVVLAGRDYQVDIKPVTGPSRPADSATLFILYPEDQLTSQIQQAVYPALIAGAVAAAIALAITTWLARRLANPIHTLVAQTATIAQGDFIPMPLPRNNDELRDLAESINRMAGRLSDYEQQVRRNERLKTLGQLGAAMAHQLRNAATGGRMAIELHRGDCPNGLTDESLDVALRQLRLMESYLRQFLSIEGPTPSVSEQVDVGLLVDEVLGLLRPSCVHAGIDLQFARPPHPVAMEGDREALRQLVTNLVLNAVEAARSGNAQRARVLVELAPDGDGSASLRIRDTGPGLAPAVCEKLFDSLVTTKPDGAGLGLFVANQIAKRHGGRLHWERRDEMTCFVFGFPIACECDHGSRTDCG